MLTGKTPAGRWAASLQLQSQAGPHPCTDSCRPLSARGLATNHPRKGGSHWQDRLPSTPAGLEDAKNQDSCSLPGETDCLIHLLTPAVAALRRLTEAVPQGMHWHTIISPQVSYCFSCPFTQQRDFADVPETLGLEIGSLCWIFRGASGVARVSNSGRGG